MFSILVVKIHIQICALYYTKKCTIEVGGRNRTQDPQRCPCAGYPCVCQLQLRGAGGQGDDGQTGPQVVAAATAQGSDVAAGHAAVSDVTGPVSWFWRQQPADRSGGWLLSLWLRQGVLHSREGREAETQGHKLCSLSSWFSIIIYGTIGAVNFQRPKISVFDILSRLIFQILSFQVPIVVRPPY